MNALRSGAGFAVVALVLSSCVTQRKYDEALDTAQFYQRQYHDLAQYQPELEAENERLRAQLDDGVVVQDAAYTDDIDARMQELNRMLEGLGRESGDVTMFRAEGGYGYRVKDSILFDSGSDQIRAEGRELLLSIAGDLRQAAFERVWVRGHTDSDPVKRPETLQRYPHGNLQLSAARAIEVAALLRGQGGIDSKKIAIAGLGESEPLEKNDSATNKQRNRRVEIFVSERAE